MYAIRSYYAHDEAGGHYELAHVALRAERTPAGYMLDGHKGVVVHGEQAGLLLGRFGPEMAFMTEAAARHGTEQIIGSDDPTALARITSYNVCYTKLLRRSFPCNGCAGGVPNPVLKIRITRRMSRCKAP